MTELSSRRAVREFERSRSGRRPQPSAHATRPPRRPAAKPPRRSGGSRFFSVFAMLFAAALLVGTTIPANAFLSAPAVEPGTPASKILDPQSLAVDGGAAGDAAARDAFTSMSWAEVLSLKYSSGAYQYTATSGSVRWPFPFASKITDGFGPRADPCSGCQPFHNGLDFTPGGGTPIYAVADGIVTYAEVSDVGFGNHVFIASTVNGEQIEALYAHMQMNSSPLQIGQTVKAGDFVGLVGTTGLSTGNHLHLEIKSNGVNVDPFAWLNANAN